MQFLQQQTLISFKINFQTGSQNLHYLLDELSLQNGFQSLIDGISGEFEEQIIKSRKRKVKTLEISSRNIQINFNRNMYKTSVIDSIFC